jgi:hypothetical protein
MIKLVHRLLILGLASLPGLAPAQPYTFVTLAGAANQRGTNDGVNAEARFYWPRCVALGPSGDLFVTDDRTVRRLTVAGTNWTVTTIAGLPRVTGSADGTNSTARFDTPSGLAVDATTNIYVADFDTHTIRKITPSGTNWIVTTIAGTANTPGDADGTNQTARFLNPFGLTLDLQGNLFVADAGNHTVRKVTPAGTNWIVTTIAGLAGSPGSADGTNYLARFRQPRDVALDSNGGLYVTDRLNATVRRLLPDGTNWIITTVAGLSQAEDDTDGTNEGARFSAPDGLAIDSLGHLFLTDNGNENIRNLVPVGTNWVSSTIGGRSGVRGFSDGTGTNALFNYPDSIKIAASGQLYIADRDNYVIRLGVSLKAPMIRIAPAPGQVTLSWPVTELPFQLESSAVLSTNPSWNPVITPPVEVNGVWTVTNAPAAPALYYRLRHP